LTFGEHSVTVSGTTPGADVVFYAIAKEPSAGVPAIPLKTRHAVVLHDIDHTGTVRFERDRSVPQIGIWIAVDLATGQWVASGSPGFDERKLPLQDFVKADAAGQLRKLSADVPQLDAVLVRPGAGAWMIYVAKTSGLDESARDGGPLRVDVSGMLPLRGSPAPPAAFRLGDILVIIDPLTMRFAVVEVGK
jgi:hypothetical protein